MSESKDAEGRAHEASRGEPLQGPPVNVAPHTRNEVQAGDEIHDENGRHYLRRRQRTSDSGTMANIAKPNPP